MGMGELWDIYGKKVLLVWFWWNENLWDELILLWLVQLLRRQKKSITISTNDEKKTQNFLHTYIDTTDIRYTQELPRGIRSFIKMIGKWIGQTIYEYFKTDSIILWGGECFTEELPNSYRYRTYSFLPMMLRKIFRKGGLYITWGIQAPKTLVHKAIFKALLHSTDFIYARDFESIDALHLYQYKKTTFLMDLAYFALDRTAYKTQKKEKQIVINVNSHGTHYLPEIADIAKTYLAKGYKVWYAPIWEYTKKPDSMYFSAIQKLVHHDKNFTMLDRRKPSDHFIETLASSEIAIGTRLHLFLISEYLGVKTQVFPYQKKILKMQKVLQTLKI